MQDNKKSFLCSSDLCFQSQVWLEKTLLIYVLEVNYCGRFRLEKLKKISGNLQNVMKDL
jgi:hypothetical protein